MTDPARKALTELVTRHGRSLGDDTQRCEALLRDHLASHRREVNLLVAALKARAVAELQRSSGTASWSVQAPRLMARLEDELGLAPDAARWAIESWGLALGLVSEAEIARAPQPAAGAARPHAGEPPPPPARLGRFDGHDADVGAAPAPPPGPHAWPAAAPGSAAPGASTLVDVYRLEKAKQRLLELDARYKGSPGGILSGLLAHLTILVVGMIAGWPAVVTLLTIVSMVLSIVIYGRTATRRAKHLQSCLVAFRACRDNHADPGELERLLDQAP